MAAPQGGPRRHRRAADRQHSGDPHRRRHRRCVCDRLRRVRAVRFPRAGDRLHPAGPGRAGHAGGGPAARPGAGRPRRRRRLCHADPGVFEPAGLSGRSTSISPSSPPHPSRWRGSGCGAGSRSPPSSLRWPGPFRAWNAWIRWSARMCSTSSRASSSPRCWWSAASCSARRRRKARSSRSPLARSRPICSAPPPSSSPACMPMPR